MNHPRASWSQHTGTSSYGSSYNSRTTYHDPCSANYEDEHHEMNSVNSRRTRNQRDLRSFASDAPLLGPNTDRADEGNYDHGSRIWAALGIGFSIQCSIALAGLGAYIWIRAKPSTNGLSSGAVVNVDYYPDNSQGILVYWDLGVADWIPKLALNAVVTLCNVATGNVHATTLKWALIERGESGFNANLRFFTAIAGLRGLFSMNGHIANFLHAACLIISQASVSVILLPGPQPGQHLIPAMPLFAIAGSLFIQSSLVLVSFIRTKVRTWSSSPLDVAQAARLERRLARQEYRTMRPAADAKSTQLILTRPKDRQPNAWESHRQVKVVVLLVWAMVFASLMWSYTLFALIASGYNEDFVHGGCKPQFFLPPNSESGTAQICSVSFTFNRWASVKGQLPNNLAIGLNLLLFVILQGVLAAGLHCCEMIVTMSRDEDVWRGGSANGAEHVGNQLYNFWSWKSLALLAFNPVLHWIMGNSLVINQGATAMYPMQVRFFAPFTKPISYVIFSNS